MKDYAMKIRGQHGEQRTRRSAAGEWPPHRPRGDRSAEWWTLTAVIRDPAGLRYFLSWSVTHPGLSQLGPGQGLYACRFTLISCQASLRKVGVPAVFVMNDDEVWDEEASALCLRDVQHEDECLWSFDGERMDLAVSSPTLAFSLKIQGGSQVMWTGYQDGADGGRSFCYSLPRLRIAGSVTYADERGKPTAVDVSGSGWADRQWGDAPAGQGGP
jgi:hypothetical protein